MAICIQRRSPISSSTTFTRSMSPIDTPPLVRRRSQSAAPARTVARIASASSATRPRSTGVAPASATSASRVSRLESWIWPGPRVVPGGTSSSPVESTPTRGRGWACTSVAPMPASTPRCPGVSTSPAANTASPACRSSPAARTCRPGATSAWIATTAPSARRSVALHHHHRVGAVGHRRAGEDAHRLARGQGAVGGVTGGHLGHDRQLDRGALGGAGGVGRLHRVPVHRRVRERGHVGRRGDGLGQHEAGRLGPGHRQRARRQRRHPLEDEGPGLLQGDHARPSLRRCPARARSRRARRGTPDRGPRGPGPARRWPGGSRACCRRRSDRGRTCSRAPPRWRGGCRSRR